MKCLSCNKRIAKDRREYIRLFRRPELCKQCSTETPRMVLMEYGHKTAGYPVIVPQGAEDKALRCYRRCR